MHDFFVFFMRGSVVRTDKNDSSNYGARTNIPTHALKRRAHEVRESAQFAQLEVR